MSFREANVLLIDDSAVGRELVTRAFQNSVIAMGVRITAVSGLKEAAKVFEERGTRIDVVILDMHLESGDPQGYDAIVAVRERYQCRSPIVVYSGSKIAGIDRLSRLAGVTAYLQKSDNLDPLVDAVADAIGKLRQTRSDNAEVYDRFDEIQETVEAGSKSQAEMMKELKKQGGRLEGLEETIDGCPGKLGLKEHCKRRTRLINGIGWAIFVSFIGGVVAVLVAKL